MASTSAIGAPELVAGLAIFGIALSVIRRLNIRSEARTLVTLQVALMSVSLIVVGSLFAGVGNPVLLLITFPYHVPIELSGLALVATFLDYVLAQEGFARS